MTNTEKLIIEAGKKALVIKETDKRYYKALLEFAKVNGWIRAIKFQEIKAEVETEMGL